MKKIMFNDRYGLTRAVLEGRKTITRRLVPKRIAKMLESFSKPILMVPDQLFPAEVSLEEIAKHWQEHRAPLVSRPKEALQLVKSIDVREKAAKLSGYKVGEIVAVAQRYCDVYDHDFAYDFGIDLEPGWRNKMFVTANEMPHQIRITNVRVERLQDISDEDCLKEGIFWDYGDYPYMGTKMYKYDQKDEYIHPKAAFAALIDKISGKGTWESNPWVFVYEFELEK